MNIDGLGPQVVELLLSNNKITDIADLYTLKVEDIEELERMGKKSAENLVSAIEESKSRGLERLLFALGIRQVGEVAAEAPSITSLLQASRTLLLLRISVLSLPRLLWSSSPIPLLKSGVTDLSLSALIPRQQAKKRVSFLQALLSF